MPTRIFATLALAAALAGCGASHPTPPGGGVDMTVTNACTHCNAPGMCCNNKCLDVTADKFNCGACGHMCANGSSCVGGVCQCGSSGTCSAGQTCCPSNVGCKNITNDSQNCGACGKACSDGETCVDSKCACGSSGMVCTNGLSCCGGTCLDTQSTDVNNCGACGTVCNMGDTCTAGACSGGQPVGDGGVCACTKKCLLGCLGGCCLEDLLSGCTPDVSCVGLGG